MMFEFAETFRAAETRDRQKLNMSRLKIPFRRNLLANAPVGGGRDYDFILKQAVGTQSIGSVNSEIQFFTDLFNSEPQEIIFLFREPYGYCRSAKKKFNLLDDEMIIHYVRAFETFKENGGIAIEYGVELNNFFANHHLFKKARIDPFEPKQIVEIDGLDKLQDWYNEFKSYMGSRDNSGE